MKWENLVTYKSFIGLVICFFVITASMVGQNTPPPNDSPCPEDPDPLFELIDGVTYSATTCGAIGYNDNMVDDFPNQNCGAASQDDAVWHTFKPSSDHDGIEIGLNKISLGEQSSLEVYIGDTLAGCDGHLTLVNAICQWEQDTVLRIPTCYSSDSIFWLKIGSSESDCGSYNLGIINFNNETDGFADECHEASPVLMPETDPTGATLGSPDCQQGNLQFACPETTYVDCGQNVNPTVWFQLMTDSDAAQMFIDVTPNGSWAADFVVYEGTNCGDLIPMDNSMSGGICSQSVSTSVTGQFEVSGELVYWIAISASGDLDDPGFEICVTATIDLITCVPSNATDFTVNTEPVGGTAWDPNEPINQLCPGQTYNICMNFFYDASASGAEWLQGVIPQFGSGWDINSFDPNIAVITPPASIASGGVPVQWFPENTTTLQERVPNICTFINSQGYLEICNELVQSCNGVCAVGMIAGEFLPGGWFWLSTGNNGGCTNTGIPETMWGIGSVTADVNICFDIAVRKFDTQAECLDNNDLQISFMPFSDGIAGCWEDPTGECGIDYIQFVPLLANCEITPEVVGDGIEPSPQVEVCSGSPMNANIMTDDGSIADLIVTYDPLNDPRVSGATPMQTFSEGLGIITDVLINDSYDPIEEIHVRYFVEVDAGEGYCPASRSEVWVTVYPNLTIDGETVVCCRESDVLLTANVTGGNGTYTMYEWAADPESPIGSQIDNDYLVSPAIEPGTYTYSVTVSGDNSPNCSGVGQVRLIVQSAIDTMDLNGETPPVNSDNCMLQYSIDSIYNLSTCCVPKCQSAFDYELQGCEDLGPNSRNEIWMELTDLPEGFYLPITLSFSFDKPGASIEIYSVPDDIQDSLTLVNSFCSIGVSRITQIASEAGSTLWLRVFSSNPECISFSFQCSKPPMCFEENESQFYLNGEPVGGEMWDPNVTTNQLNPGETYEICIDFFVDTSISGEDWLSGIIPKFGSGWDRSTFDPDSAVILPASSLAQSGMPVQWFPENTTYIQENLPHICSYVNNDGYLELCNGFTEACTECELGMSVGEFLPGGWFWLSEALGGGCENSGIPATMFGIGAETVDISICFDITVKCYKSSQECLENRDLSISFMPFTDGVAGCWEDPQLECYLFESNYVSLLAKCEDITEIDIEDISKTICSSESTKIPLHLEQGVIESIIPTFDVTSVHGAQQYYPLTDSFYLDDVLINDSDSPLIVEYIVEYTINDVNFCETYYQTIIITVLPELNYTDQNDNCLLDIHEGVMHNFVTCCTLLCQENIVQELKFCEGSDGEPLSEIWIELDALLSWTANAFSLGFAFDQAGAQVEVYSKIDSNGVMSLTEERGFCDLNDSLSIEFQCLEHSRWLRVLSFSEECLSFTVQVVEESACKNATVCEEAMIIDLNESSDHQICIDDCKPLTCGAQSITSCEVNAGGEKWYEINTSSVTDFIEINVSQSQFIDDSEPFFHLYADGCAQTLLMPNELSQNVCSVEIGTQSLGYYKVEPNRNYLLALNFTQNSANSTTEEMYFDMCVRSISSMDDCVQHDSKFYFDGIAFDSDSDSEALGICPGQTYNICVEYVFDSNQTGDRLMAAYPYFGNAWDGNSFDFNTAVVSATNTANQNNVSATWIAEGSVILVDYLPSICIYNDVLGKTQFCDTSNQNCEACSESNASPGNALPGGWYWYSLPQEIDDNCLYDNSPNSAIGLEGSVSSVNVCFDLRTHDREVIEMLTDIDMTVGVLSLPQSKISCNSNSSSDCIVKALHSISPNLNVHSIDSLNPDLDLPIEICTGNEFVIENFANYPSNYEINQVDLIQSGSDVLGDIYIGDDNKQLIFELSIEGEEAVLTDLLIELIESECGELELDTIPLLILPILEVSSESNVCLSEIGEELELLITISNQESILSVDWFALDGAPIGMNNNFSYVLNRDQLEMGEYRYELVVTDSFQCTHVGFFDLNIHETPQADIQLEEDLPFVNLISNSINADSVKWLINSSLIESQEDMYSLELFRNGIYDIQLIAFNQCGTDTTETIYQADLFPSFSDVDVIWEPCVEELIELQIEAHNVDTWFWSFESGIPSSSNEEMPQVSWSDSGGYDIELTIGNIYSDSTKVFSDIIQVKPKPVAGFTYSTTNDTIKFTNISNHYDVVIWDFGDGQMTTDIEPCYVYEDEGSYNVALIVENDCGKDTFRLEVIVGSLEPMARFSVLNANGCSPHKVQMMDISANNPTAWFWTFPGGNPSISTIRNPLVTYNIPGTYPVYLTVSNQFGESSDTLFNAVQLFEEISIQGESSHCLDEIEEELLINAEISGGTGSSQEISWVPISDAPVGIVENGQYTISGQDLNPGIYQYNVEVVDNIGCEGSGIVTVNLELGETLELNIPDNAIICSDLEDQYVIEITNLENESEYSIEWLPFNGAQLIPTQDSSRLIIDVKNSTFEGENLIRLNVVRSGSQPSCVSTKEIYLNFLEGPEAQFQFNLDFPTLNIDNLSSHASDFEWSFGSENSTLENPSFEISENGNYEIRLIASNDCGKDTVHQELNIGLYPSIFGINDLYWEACPGEIVDLAVQSASVDNWEWTFEQADPMNSNSNAPQVVWTSPGLYDITLNVSNEYSDSSYVLNDVVVIRENPQAGFIYNENNGEVNFINQSTNSDSFRWDFGDGRTSDEPNPMISYTQEGTYLVRLIATGFCGSDTTETIVEISNLRPVTDLSWSETTGCSPLNVLFEDLSSNGPTSWLWQFEGGIPAMSEEQHPVVEYMASGFYDVMLKSTNDFGSDSMMVSLEIIVLEKPMAEFSFQTSGLAVNFENQSVNGSTYLWDFGDGNTSVEQNPEHIYDVSGEYSVSLTVTNDCGEETKQSQISVEPSFLNEVSFASHITVSPNPSTGVFNIKCAEIKVDQLALNVYSLIGQKLVEIEVTELTKDWERSLDLRHLLDGLYLLEISHGEERFVQKLQIVK